jgi:hypothetical protein
MMETLDMGDDGGPAPDEGMQRPRLVIGKSKEKIAIKKYIIHFTIPIFADRQLKRFVRNITQLNLTDKQKEELLEQAYWANEERKLIPT